MLDPYLVGSTDARGAAPPSDSAFAAVHALGIADSSASGAAYPGLPGMLPTDTLSGLRAAFDSLAPALDSGRTIFGLSMFQRRTTAFDANLAGPVDANYTLGPGDQLVLILTGEAELAHTLEVTREGFMVIPQVGQLHVANLTLGQLEALLESRLGRAFGPVGRGPDAPTRFSISVSRLRTNQVFVVGDALVPGSYQISSAGTALTALYAAGGPSANGSLRRIEVRRGGRVVDTLDVYDYLLRGDASHDVRLQTGDVVFVPVHGPRARVVGEVVRSATYELKAGESLAELLRAAGGYTAEAAQRRVMVERILPPGQRAPDGRDRVVLDVTADQLAGGHGPAVRVEAGDVVSVFAVAQQVRDRIAIEGDVWAPGPQGFTPGMKLSDALRRAGGVRADAYLDDVLITRLLPDSSQQQLRATLRDRSGALVNDLALEENDHIRVFSIAEFRPDQFVAIDGAVQKGGRFPYRVGMTLRDLVLLAGGLDESAYIEAAEVARMPEGGDRRTTAHTIRVRLDSTYFAATATAGRTGGSRRLGDSGEDGVTLRRSTPDVLLRPHDNVLILRRPDWAVPRTVVLTGEVKFPGRYTLAARTERLADLLARAGGLTPEAYAGGVTFYRTEGRRGRVGVDLPSVMQNPQHRDNLLLQDGDSVYIPQYAAMVDVGGAVNSPISVAYVPGAGIDYYIRAAGGGSRKADLHRAYVRQPNGKVESVKARRLLPDAVPRPRAGGLVYVPELDPADKPNYVAAVGAVAQVLGAVVAIIAIVAK
jgi:protein involved in polysaccharide export with SLBB domain